MKNRMATWGWICLGTGAALLVVMAILWGTGVWGGRDGGCDGDCLGGESNGSEVSGPAAMDRHFIEQMIPHHEDAVAMARLALTRAEHPELAELAQAIIDSQTREIDQMRTWYKAWYGVDVPAGGGGMMSGGMMGGGTDLEALESAAEFDREFIDQMIPHHQMGVMMGSMIAGTTGRPELQELADAIITVQTSEIEQMREWYQSWY